MGRGVCLVVLVVWEVCVAINCPPATCILTSAARSKACWWWCSCRGVRSLEEDESDGWGCALPGQPWSLDGTCLQFSLSVTRPTDL